MRILVYGNGSLSVAQQERKLCLEFAKMGHKVFLLTDVEKRLFDVGELETHDNLEIFHMPYYEYRFDFISFYEKIDVVLGMDQSVSPFCLEYQKRLSVPAYCMYLDFPVHVIDPNGSDYNFDYSQRFYYWLMCGLELSGVIFNNNVAVEEFYKRFKRESHLVWYAISNDDYLEKRDLTNNTDKTEDYIFGLNRIIPYKGLEYVIEALDKIKLPYQHGYVSCDKKYFDMIKEKANKVNNTITFIEKLSERNKMEFLYNANMLIYPQITEWIGGLSLIEGMSVKTPGICFDYPVLRELYEDCALYAKPKDSNDLSKKMNLLYKDKDLRNELKENGYNRFKKYFTRKAMATKLLKILED